jgi:hypothetical protein
VEFFADENAVVTEHSVSLVKTGATFRTRDITSVRILAISSWWWIAYVGWLVFFIGLYYGSLGVLCSATRTGQDLLGFGGALAFAGIFTIFLSRRLPPFRHNVLIGVAGQEMNLIYSADADWSNRLASSIRDAMLAARH